MRTPSLFHFIQKNPQKLGTAECPSGQKADLKGLHELVVSFPLDPFNVYTVTTGTLSDLTKAEQIRLSNQYEGLELDENTDLEALAEKINLDHKVGFLNTPLKSERFGFEVYDPKEGTIEAVMVIVFGPKKPITIATCEQFGVMSFKGKVDASGNIVSAEIVPINLRGVPSNIRALSADKKHDRFTMGALPYAPSSAPTKILLPGVTAPLNANKTSAPVLDGFTPASKEVNSPIKWGDTAKPFYFGYMTDVAHEIVYGMFERVETALFVLNILNRDPFLLRQNADTTKGQETVRSGKPRSTSSQVFNISIDPERVRRIIENRPKEIERAINAGTPYGVKGLHFVRGHERKLMGLKITNVRRYAKCDDVEIKKRADAILAKPELTTEDYKALANLIDEFGARQTKARQNAGASPIHNIKMAPKREPTTGLRTGGTGDDTPKQ